jgi:hypothetical protein
MTKSSLVINGRVPKDARLRRSCFDFDLAIIKLARFSEDSVEDHSAPRLGGTKLDTSLHCGSRVGFALASRFMDCILC